MTQPYMQVIQTEKPQHTKEKLTKAQIKHMRDKDREMVKGIFKFYEVPNGTMQFVFKCYKEDPLERYTFVDGGVYSIPLGVAKHLNKNGWYPVHEHAQDANGNNIYRINQRVRRFGFQSLEFIDTEDLTEVGGSSLVTVEKVA